MRDHLRGHFPKSEPLDPTEAAQRNMRPRAAQALLQRREHRGRRGAAFGLAARRPAGADAGAPPAGGADARRSPRRWPAEWQAQGEVIDPADMPLTRLANTIIDGVARCAGAGGGGSREISRHRSGVLSRRKPRRTGRAPGGGLGPRARLGARRARRALHAAAHGLVLVAQPEASLARCAPRFRAMQRRSERRSGGSVRCSAITTLTGSALIALAVLHGRCRRGGLGGRARRRGLEHGSWGRDEPALERRAVRFAEMQAAATVLEALALSPVHPRTQRRKAGKSEALPTILVQSI